MFGDKEFDGVGYPTPSFIPDERGCRTATIPASAEFYAIFMGLLETLTHEENWQQFEGGISREDAACYWQEIIDSLYLSAEEDDCVDCCPIFRRNPATGLTQGSYDGGVTWENTPDGPYIDSDGPPLAAAPPPLAQGSDDEDICAAAWNAAAVIAQFYKTTAGEAAAGLYNIVLDANMALWRINHALLNLVYPDAAQLEAAIGWSTFNWATYASAATLTDHQVHVLRCWLLDNATVTAGIVHFDQPTILAGLITELGVNPGTALTLLVGYMDVAGLDAAGGVAQYDHPDCSDCDDCGDIFSDFTGGLGPWVVPAFNGNANMVWASTGGRTAPGCVKTTHSIGGTATDGETTFDLGQECTVDAVNFWKRAAVAGGAMVYAIGYYRADHTLIFGTGLLSTSNSTTYNQVTNSTPRANCRYVGIYFQTNNTTQAVWMDDVGIAAH